MKTRIRNLAVLTLIPAAILALSSCSHGPKGERTQTVAMQEGVPGGAVVDTYKTIATVTGIDAANRKVTLANQDGTKSTFKAGPEVVNFDQIQVGDRVKATVTEEIVVFMRKPGTPPSDGQATMVALAPKGPKPGVMMADTVEATAKVEAIDLKHHKATLRFAEGESKTFKVRTDVDLTQAKLGEEVVIRSTEAVAIIVEKP